MALSTQRHGEINEELRQIRERLMALADEIATETVPQQDYEVTYKALNFVAREVGHAQHLMKLSLRASELKKLRAL